MYKYQLFDKDFPDIAFKNVSFPRQPKLFITLGEVIYRITKIKHPKQSGEYGKIWVTPRNENQT